MRTVRNMVSLARTRLKCVPMEVMPEADRESVEASVECTWNKGGEIMRYSVACLAVVLVLLPLVAAADYLPTTIYLIQQGTYAVGTNVEVDSVIVTGVDLKPTTFGFTAQELPGGPYSGILCYMSYDRPDTVSGGGIEIGDIVRVRGYYDEYFDQSEIQVDQVTIRQKNYAVPACTLLSCGDLGYSLSDSLFAEQWEGVLICVDTVQVINHGTPPEYAEWTVEEYHYDPGIGLGDSLMIDDKLIDPTLSPPPLGDTLSSITGVYAYEYDYYRVWPRSVDDLVFMGATPGPHLLIAYATSNTTIQAVFDRPLNQASAETKANYFLDSGNNITLAQLLADTKTVKLTTNPVVGVYSEILRACNIQAAGGGSMPGCESSEFYAGITPISYIQTPAHSGTDSSQVEGEQVTVAGVVTGSSFSFGGPFFMQDAPGPWNGMYVYMPQARYDVGDSVVISGIVQEYYNWTEMTSIDYAKRYVVGASVGLTVVPPESLTNSSPVAESYENVLVQLDSVEVLTFLDSFGEWTAGIAPDTVNIGDFAVEAGDGYDYPGLGSWARITGCYRYYFTYRIEPRDSADTEILVPCSASIKDGRQASLRLYQNRPNPFETATAIRFALPSNARARLAVYDVAGRLVRVVADEVMPAGEHTVQWDGRDSHGSMAGPGIYFCRLATPERSLQNKMVLLK
jgi:hypothetical protein